MEVPAFFIAGSRVRDRVVAVWCGEFINRSEKTGGREKVEEGWALREGGQIHGSSEVVENSQKNKDPQEVGLVSKGRRALQSPISANVVSSISKTDCLSRLRVAAAVDPHRGRCSPFTSRSYE